jgi:hypothetical protein
MKLYKLTDQKMQTYNGFQWKLGKKRTASGEGLLCGPGWLHAYESPLVAAFMNPAHAAFQNPRLFEAMGKIGKRDGQLKCGCTTLTLIREITLPEITTAARVRAAIYCAWSVCKDPAWRTWALLWLAGEDRSAAAAAEMAAWAGAGEMAADAAAEMAAWAADAAAVCDGTSLHSLIESAIADEAAR